MNNLNIRDYIQNQKVKYTKNKERKDYLKLIWAKITKNYYTVILSILALLIFLKPDKMGFLIGNWITHFVGTLIHSIHI